MQRSFRGGKNVTDKKMGPVAERGEATGPRETPKVTSTKRGKGDVEVGGGSPAM